MDKTVSDFRLLYGIDKTTRRLVFIDEVQNGLACNCICPECGCELEARNGGQIRMHTFAHYSENKAHHKGRPGNTSKSCSGSSETILHRAAKQVFEESKNQPIELPAEVFNTCLKPYYLADLRTVTIDRVETEESFNNIRPDITVYTSDGKRIFVEVCVTHPVDDEKKNKLRNIGTPCLEVDISGISIEHGIPWEDLKRILLNNNSNRKWIYTPVLDRLYQKKRRFDKIVHFSDVEYSDTCVLLPEDERDNVFRCYSCPFFAGEKFNYPNSYCSYCSAHQLINMQDIGMSENDVMVLVETVKKEQISEHKSYLIEQQKKAAEQLIHSIRITEETISGIGEVSLNSADLISQARNLYNSIPESERFRVNNIHELESAEKALKLLQEADYRRKEEEKRIREVELMIRPFADNVYFSLLKWWEYPRLKERVEKVKELYFSLPETAQIRVNNRDALIQILESRKSEEFRIIEEKRRDSERNAKVELFLNSEEHKRKKIYRNDKGNYVVEGDCPINIALNNVNTSKAYYECAQCALCERNTDLTGPNQFIVCNGCDDSKLKEYLKSINGLNASDACD